MLALYVCVIVSILLAKPWTDYFWLLQITLIAPLIYLAWQQFVKVGTTLNIMIDDSGKVEIEQNQQWLRYKLRKASLIGIGFCVLRLDSDSPLEPHHQRRLVLWRDGVDDVSFRRVCRVIARVSRGQ